MTDLYKSDKKWTPLLDADEWIGPREGSVSLQFRIAQAKKEARDYLLMKEFTRPQY